MKRAKRYRGGEGMKARALLNKLEHTYVGKQVTRHGVTRVYELATGGLVSENELAFMRDQHE